MSTAKGCVMSGGVYVMSSQEQWGSYEYRQEGALGFGVGACVFVVTGGHDGVLGVR